MGGRLHYNALTHRYFKSAALNGSLLGECVGRGAAGDEDSGCRVQFDLALGPTGIEAARFQAFGCPHTLAVCAWLCEQASARTSEAERSADRLSVPASEPALPESIERIGRRFEVPREKMSRLLLIEDAWLAAIRQAVTKRGNLRPYNRSHEGEGE